MKKHIIGLLIGALAFLLVFQVVTQYSRQLATGNTGGVAIASSAASVDQFATSASASQADSAAASSQSEAAVSSSEASASAEVTATPEPTAASSEASASSVAESSSSSSAASSESTGTAVDGEPLANGTVVNFAGGPVYLSSDSESESVEREASRCTVTYYVEGAPHPYHCISQDGKNVYGWVDAADITPVE